MQANMWNKHLNAKKFVEPELKVFQDHLLTNCLCKLPPTVSPDTALHFSVRSDVDHLLMQVCCVELICAQSLKQSTNPYRCRTLVELRSQLVRRQSHVAHFLVSLADDHDRYVRYAAARALAVYFVVLRNRLDQTWLRNLVDYLTVRAPPHRMLFALQVLKRLIDWSDFDEHLLEDCLPQDEMPAGCHGLSMHVDCADTSDVKCACVETLAPEWPRIVAQLSTLIRDRRYGCALAFLALWQAIVSVKANLSVVDTKPFFGSLETSVSLLATDVPPLLWKRLLGLFNEALCYGSTLALQHELAGEPCALAHLIVRHVKDRRLLRSVPLAGDNTLLGQTALLVLKAAAVTVKEAKYSSGDSSAGSEEDRDMDVIGRSIHDVLRKLDAFVKRHRDFHPGTRLASWMVRLFADRHDYLVESMVCCVDMARVLCCRSAGPLRELRNHLNPSETFLAFLNATSFDVDLLVDYLESTETCFLLYALNFLKYLRDQWGEFVDTCKYELPAVGKLFGELRARIEREVRLRRITYNIGPVLSLLVACEQRICAPLQ